MTAEKNAIVVSGKVSGGVLLGVSSQIKRALHFRRDYHPTLIFMYLQFALYARLKCDLHVMSRKLIEIRALSRLLQYA